MKKIYNVKAFLLIALLSMVMPSVSNAKDTAAATVNTEARATQLKSRLDEIKAMDTKSLNSSQKRELRKEVRTIKKELTAIGGGVYLSVGALILIALLLILLL
jgi:hypothetical protein